MKPLNLCPICELRPPNASGFICDPCDRTQPPLSVDRMAAQYRWITANDPAPRLTKAIALVCNDQTSRYLRETMRDVPNPPFGLSPTHAPIWISVHCLTGEVYLPQTKEERDALVDGSFWVKQLNPQPERGNMVYCTLTMSDNSTVRDQGQVIWRSEDRTMYRVEFAQYGIRFVHVRSVIAVLQPIDPQTRRRFTGETFNPDVG